MPDLKVLTLNAWKTVSNKCDVENDDLQEALAEYNKLADDEHEDLLECIADIKDAAKALKASKEAKASKELLKYVTDVLAAADSEQKDISKDKGDAEKAKKAEKDKEGDEDGEEEDEEGEYADKLLGALKKLKGAKGLTYQFLVCDGKPPAVVIAKKISPRHKEEASHVTGSKRFLHVGHCRFDGSHYIFDMEKPVSGLAKKLQESLKHHTGKRHPIKVGDEAAGEEEEGASPLAAAGAAAVKGAAAAAEGIGAAAGAAATAAAGAKSPRDVASGDKEPAANMTRPFEISGSVGKGGKNAPEDVQAVQIALNKKDKAGLTVDGKSGPATIAAIMEFQKKIGMHTPDGRIDPGRGTARALANSGPLPPPQAPPKPVAAPKLGKAELAKAPDVWRGMQDIVEKNLEEIKKAVKGHYAHEHPDLVKRIHEGLGKLDDITEKLDQRIADTLARAHAAKDEAARKAELKNAKTILAGYIQYVKSEPLIAHVDKNPWVKVDLKKTIIDTITHMAQSIGT
jgi:peptidoglycan hydrolase-like protein with peptidoglycan-binding domain